MAPQFSELHLSAGRFDPQQRTITIHFQSSADGFATLAVFSPDGAWLLNAGEVPVQAGTNELVWTGRDLTGTPLAAGRYTLELFGYDCAHRPTAATLRVQVEISQSGSAP